MRKLSIFDDGELVATITPIDANFLIFARSSREWSEMKRLLDAVRFLKEADSNVNILDSLITMLHNYNYSTELINE